MTPSLSGSGRFRLTFHFPTSFSIGISIPTFCCEFMRRIAHLPWKRLVDLARIGQLCEMSQQPFLIFNGARQTLCVNHSIVPGRYGFAVLMFAWIPRGRYVGIRALENDHRVYGGRKRSPNTVCTRDLVCERPMFPLGAVEKEGDVIHDEFAFTFSHPCAQRMRCDKSTQYRLVGLFVDLVCRKRRMCLDLPDRPERLTPKVGIGLASTELSTGHRARPV